MTNPNQLKGFQPFDDPNISSGEPNPKDLNPEFNSSESSIGNFAASSSYFCPNCGHPSPRLNLYCGQCGTYIVDPFENAKSPPVTSSHISQSQAETPPNSSRQSWLAWGMGGAILVALVLAVVFLNKGNLTPKTDSPAAELVETATVANQKATESVRRPTATSRLTRTPSQQVSTCPGAPKQRLEVGKDARVCTQSDNVYLRSGPSRSHSVIERVSPGTVVNVIGGPECANDWSFWEVEIPDGTTGWMSEGGDAIDPYFLCPN